MAELSKKKRQAPSNETGTSLQLDCDRLALFAGAVVATVSMAIGFYFEVDILAALVRAAFSYFATYVLVFLLVFVIREVLDREERRTRIEEARRRREESEGSSGAGAL
jgi:Na+-transporting methylmalonyl-CoA/oxaloacetate decarboxylase beta subunit